MNIDDASNPQNFYSHHLPDWNHWRTLKKAKLWQAVALACNLDPLQFTLFGSQDFDKIFSRPPEKFNDLLNLAKNNLGSTILRPRIFNADAPAESEIELPKFGAWLKSIRYPVSEEFPWQDEQSLPLSREWPWGTYETDLLRTLAEAANKYWRNYDPEDPSSAPTNETVINWLEKQGVSNRVAQTMATILRADKLPMGRR